jgi:hypothetical protein
MLCCCALLVAVYPIFHSACHKREVNLVILTSSNQVNHIDMMASHRYEPAPTEPDHDRASSSESILPLVRDDEKCRVQITSKPRSRLSIFPLLVLAVTGIVSLMFLVLMEQHQPEKQDPIIHRMPEECGQSPAEARQLGCVFDIVTMGWIPWRCHDAGLAANFLSRDDWAFYRTANMSDRIPTEDIMAGEWDEVYVEYRYHVIHCTYAWRKTQRAAMRGDVLDGYIADDHHTNHCEMMLLHEPLAENSAYIKYISCPWVHDQDQGRFGWYRMMGGKKTYRQA